MSRWRGRTRTLLCSALALCGSVLDAEDTAAPKGRITLWNGRDVTGWTVFLGDGSVAPASVWSASGGVLRFETKASGYLRTEGSFSNYHLHVEWRWPRDAAENSNSGVMVHVQGQDAVWPASFEAQLRAGNAGQIVGIGLDIPTAPMLNNRKRAPRLAEPSEKPFGEWNSYEIYCRGATIELFVNGVRQNYVDQLPVSSGAIALQMEGFPVEFREVWLTPLVAAPVDAPVIQPTTSSRTLPVPGPIRPMRLAASRERSIARPLWAGKRSLTRTTTLLPVESSVTFTRVPKAQVGWAAVRSSWSKRSPLEVFLPW